MEPMSSATMDDCETAHTIQDSRPLNPMVELDLKSEGRPSQPSPTTSSWFNSGLIKALFVLGCLLLVTSTLLAIHEAPRHHQRVYIESYPKSHVPRQEDTSLLFPEYGNTTQGGNSGNGVFSAANETAIFQD